MSDIYNIIQKIITALDEARSEILSSYPALEKRGDDKNKTSYRGIK